MKCPPPLFFGWDIKGGSHTDQRKKNVPTPRWDTFSTHTPKNDDFVPLLSVPANGIKRVVGELERDGILQQKLII